MRANTLLFALLATVGAAFARSNNDIYARPSKTFPVRDDALTARYAQRIAARQFHHIARKEPLLDICANINTDTILGDSEILGVPIKDLLGLDVCLCISALPLEIGVSVHLDALMNQYGTPLINAVVEVLIDTSLGSQQCTYPEFSTSSCSLDPCDYTCNAPYVKQDDKCVCAEPYAMCNGHCTLATCSSAVPRVHARRSTLKTDAQSSCNIDEQVCGVYGGGKNAFECINTDTNLESCGGCIAPNPFAQANSSIPVGKDCSAIENAGTVSCVSGRCVVDSCLSGLEPTQDSTGCQQLDSTTEGSKPGVQLLTVIQDVFLP